MCNWYINVEHKIIFQMNQKSLQLDLWFESYDFYNFYHKNYKSQPLTERRVARGYAWAQVALTLVEAGPTRACWLLTGASRRRGSMMIVDLQRVWRSTAMNVCG